MILQALVKYYEDLERQEKLPKQGWCQAKVSYGINLSTDGDIKNILYVVDKYDCFFPGVCGAGSLCGISSYRKTR